MSIILPLCVLLFPLARGQELLLPNTMKALSLEPGEQTELTFTVPEGIGPEDNLFISAQSPFNDPYQQPSMNVSADDGYSQNCYELSNEFNDFCKIAQEQVTVGRQFTILISCIVKCDLQIKAYFSQIWEVGWGQSYIFKPHNFSYTLPFQIQMPNNTHFSELVILARILNLQEVSDGVDIFANYGDRKVQVPSNIDYQVKAEASYAMQKMIVVSRKDVDKLQLREGDEGWIKLIVLVGRMVKMSLLTLTVNNNVFNLHFGQRLITVVQQNQDKMIIFNAMSVSLASSERIDILITVYAGDPQILLSFDREFAPQNTVSSWGIGKTTLYALGNKTREQFGYDGYIYVNISSYWSSSVMIQASVNRKSFIDMQLGTSAMIEIGHSKIQNFIFHDQNTVRADTEPSVTKHYKLVASMIEGIVDIGIAICSSLHNDSLDCLVTDPSQLQDASVNQQFSELQVQVESHGQYSDIYFDYSLSKCPYEISRSFDKKNKSQQVEIMIYSCDFIIYAFNSGSEDSKMSLEIQKLQILNFLKEGEIVHGKVQKQEYSFYAFEIIDLETINKLQFFITLISGDVSILGSNTVHYPEMNDYYTNTRVQLGIFNSLELAKKDLAQGIYHVSIYGYEPSYYTIGVAIFRQSPAEPDTDNSTKNKTQKQYTELFLKKESPQSFSINASSDQEMHFVFTSKKDQTCIIQVREVEGDFHYRVFEKLTNKLVCDKDTFQSEGENCVFEGNVNQTYLIIVKSFANENLNKTKITYVIQYSNSADLCSTYPVNTPLEIYLAPKGKICAKYSHIDPSQDLQIALSLTSLDMLLDKVQIKLIFNGNENKAIDNLQKNQKIISKDLLKFLCKTQPPGSAQSDCFVEVFFTNQDQSKPISFKAAVQSTEEAILFDGISTRVTTSEISRTKAKHFYYYINRQNSSDITIVLQSMTSHSLQLQAKGVGSREFVSKDTHGTLYPQYQQENVKAVNSTDFSPLTVLRIKADSLEDGKMASILLISVFLNADNANEDDEVIFELQATQTEKTLTYGANEISFLRKDEVCHYLIDTDPNTPSILSVRPFNAQVCFNAYLQNPSTGDIEQFKQFHTFESEEGRREVLIKIISQSCAYQISYKSLEKPMTAALQSVPYSIDITINDQLEYFLYYHKKDESFTVVPIIDAGNAKIYVTQVGVNDTLGAILNSNISTFDYYSNGLNTNVQILKDDKDFCRSCYYVIAVQGQPKVSMQLMINPGRIPLPLKEGSILTDSLANKNSRNFQFYSITTFNISITVLYGALSVRVNDPDGTEVLSKQIDESGSSNGLNMVVGRPRNLSSDEYFDYFDDKSRYNITVTALKKVSYYIKITKKDIGLRIVEGLPAKLTLSQHKNYSVVFEAIDESSSISLLVQNMNYSLGAVIQFSAIAQNTSQTMENMIAVIDQSQGSYNIALKPFKGTYFLTIFSSKDVELSIILAKRTFTHLSATRSVLMKEEAIFEIFSPKQSIMIELFLCSGQVEVLASSNYTQLQSNGNENGLISMEHASYGGHYVISASNLSGSYFIKAQSSFKSEQLLYLISYYVYDSRDGMPYRHFLIKDLDIMSDYGKQQVKISLNPIVRKDGGVMSDSVTYKLYISNSLGPITKMTKCSLGQVPTFVKIIGKHQRPKSQRIQFALTNKQIENIINGSDSFYVGGQAVLGFENPQLQHPQALYYVYDVSQLLASRPEPDQQVEKRKNLKLVIIWIIIPFLGGCILIYLAARFCLRRMSEYPMTLNEEDGENNINQSEDVIQKGTKGTN